MRKINFILLCSFILVAINSYCQDTHQRDITQAILDINTISDQEESIVLSLKQAQALALRNNKLIKKKIKN